MRLFRVMLGTVLPLVALLLLAAGCRTTFTPLPPKEGRTYQSLLEWSHRNGMPGAILLVQTPTTNFLGATGWADVKKKIPARADQAFRIGSVSKMFTGLTVAELEREGLLKTGAVITNYLPRSVTDHIANSDRITVRHLLQQRSGIPDFSDTLGWTLRYAILDCRGEWTRLRHLKYIYGKKAGFSPGDTYEYSNSNFMLLGLIIEQVTGNSLALEIRRHFLDPLQLAHTWSEGDEAARGERTHGYEPLWLGAVLDTYDWTPITGGSMGMASTVSDLAVFVRAVAASARVKALADPSMPPFGDDWGVMWQRGDRSERIRSGAQLMSRNADTPVFFGHGGSVPGYLCFAWRDPKNDITIVWFGSSTLRDGAAGGQLSWQLEAALYELTLKDASARQSTVGGGL